MAINIYYIVFVIDLAFHLLLHTGLHVDHGVILCKLSRESKLISI